MSHTAGDHSEKAYLVSNNNTEYELISYIETSIGFNPTTRYILDTKDQQGIPPGEYYLKVNNRYNRPYTSKEKIVTVKDQPVLPYAWIDNTDTIRVKREEILTIPVRHFNADYTITRGILVYRNQPSSLSTRNILCTYESTNDNYTEVSIKIPANAPLGATVTSASLTTSTSGERIYFYELNYPIKIVE